MAGRGVGRPETHRTLRASDADRDAVATSLREHFAAGRLSDDELSDRVDAAYRATTLADLERLTLDLPAPGSALPAAADGAPRRLSRHERRTGFGRFLAVSLRIHAMVFVLVNLMLVAVWAALGGGEFWPIWSLLGWGVGLGAHAAPLVAGVGLRPKHAVSRPSRIDEVEASARSERRSLAPATAPDGTVTILFSDIESSTELNAKLGDARWLELLKTHHRLVRDAVREHGGFEVKVQGDGFMIALPSAGRGVRCALAIQAAISSGLGDHPDGAVRVRIGLHTGDAIRDGDDDFYGQNVSLAARIAEQAEAGEILVSDVVKRLAESGADARFDGERTVALKGLGEHRVFTVLPA